MLEFLDHCFLLLQADIGLELWYGPGHWGTLHFVGHKNQLDHPFQQGVSRKGEAEGYRVYSWALQSNDIEITQVLAPLFERHEYKPCLDLSLELSAMQVSKIHLKKKALDLTFIIEKIPIHQVF